VKVHPHQAGENARRIAFPNSRVPRPEAPCSINFWCLTAKSLNYGSARGHYCEAKIALIWLDELSMKFHPHSITKKTTKLVIHKLAIKSSCSSNEREVVIDSE
jgi:hypothetical protein